METKTTQAVALLKSGETVKALKLFKTFKIGFTKDEKRKIEIAYESMTGKNVFFQSLQLDTATIKAEAIQLLKSKYNI